MSQTTTVNIRVALPAGFEPDPDALGNCPARCLTAITMIRGYDPIGEDIYLSEIKAVLSGERPELVRRTWLEAMEVVVDV